MDGHAVRVVFFDLGDTLGTPVFSPPPIHLAGFDVFPFVPPLLQRLASRGLRLGLISNTGEDAGPAVDQILRTASLLDPFEQALRIYSRDVGLTKADPEIFRLAASRAGLAETPHSCLFVGEDARERATAMAAGLRVCPHPLLVEEALAGEELRFVRLGVPEGQPAAPWWSVLRERPVVALHMDSSRGHALYAITSQRVLAELSNMGFGVDLLGAPDAPLREELFILRDDVARESGPLTPEGQAQRFFADREDSRLVLSSRDGDLVVALPPERSLGELHFAHARHGHTLKLIPDPLLLERWGEEPAGRPAWLAAASSALASLVPLSAEEVEHLSRIDGPALLDRVERYSGKRPVVDGEERTLASRHVSHPDNESAVMALADELRTSGQGRLMVRLHKFTHRGRALYNVEAELAGTSEEVVLVSAHLDSTAAFSHDYDEAADPAPGADDDASGVAAVLAIAERFAAMAAQQPPLRTVRFVLFNAEEEGLVGSRAYARHQRSIMAPLVGIFQMDMIGYNIDPPRTWELHAGFAQGSDVEQRSAALVDLIREITPHVSPDLELPQIFLSTSPSRDPAAGRSDHASFQAHGFAACVATEDFFSGPDPGSPAAEENPNYHRREDTFVDEAFAGDIARAVAAAAWILAKA